MAEQGAEQDKQRAARGDGPSAAAVATPTGKRAPRLTPDGRLTSGRLKGLTMNRALWVLCWPVLVESYLNWAVGFTDTAMSTTLSVDDADAIGPAAYFMWFISLIGMALGVGATAVVARSVGKGRLAVASAAVGQMLPLATVLGCVTGAAIGLLAEPAGRLVGLSGFSLDAFVLYMTIIAFGVPSASLLIGGIACLRGAGDGTSPMVIMFVVNAVNIAVSWLTSGASLFGLSSPLGLDLGIAGLAAGTVAGHTVGAVLVRYVLGRGVSGVRLTPRRMRPHWFTMRRILRIGTPNFFESLGMWVGNFLIVVLVGSIASATMADGVFSAHIIAIRLESISFLPGFALGTAVAALVGQYLGAGSPAMARTAIFRTLAAASVMMGAMGVIFIVFAKEITGRISAIESHMEQVPPLMILCGAIQIPFAVSLVVRSALRGAGDTKAVMAITWATTYAVRLPMAFFISGADLRIPNPFSDESGAMLIDIANPVGLEPSLERLWLALCIELVIRGIAFYLRFASGKWANAKV